MIPLRLMARSVVHRTQEMFLAYDRKSRTLDLKPCSYCHCWVPTEARVCRYCKAILTLGSH